MAKAPPRTTAHAPSITPISTHSPAQAIDKLIHVFISPPLQKPTPKQSALLASSQITTITISNIPIKTYTWNPPLRFNPNPRTVLLTHGIGTAASSMLSFVPPLLTAGFRIVACDHVVHGASGGEWADLDVFKVTFLRLAEMYAPVEAVVGHSVGGTMALVGLVENPEVRANVRKVVVVSAPTQFESVIGRFCVVLGLKRELGVEAQKIMEEKGIPLPGVVRRLVEKERGREMKKVDIGSLFIVQDRDDKVTTLVDAEWLAGAFANARIEITEKNGHLRILQDPKVVRLVTDFILGSEMTSPKI